MSEADENELELEEMNQLRNIIKDRFSFFPKGVLAKLVLFVAFVFLAKYKNKIIHRQINYFMSLNQNFGYDDFLIENKFLDIHLQRQQNMLVNTRLEKIMCLWKNKLLRNMTKANVPANELDIPIQKFLYCNNKNSTSSERKQYEEIEEDYIYELYESYARSGPIKNSKNNIIFHYFDNKTRSMKSLVFALNATYNASIC